MLEAHGQAGLDTVELVDVICIGSGSAGLAAAVAAAGVGQSVFVAEPRRRTSADGPPSGTEPWPTVIKRHWGAEEFDQPTADYLHELTCDLDPARQSQTHGALPVSSVESFEEASFDPQRPVAPFYGHELAGWARECLTSRYGLMFTRLAALSMPELRRQDGATIRASVIAPIPVRRSGTTLRQWLRELATERGVRIHSSSVQRLIFVDGEPVGVVLATADGIHHVWARKGVLMGTSNSTADDVLARYPAAALSGGRLSLVSRSASRFARLELLISAQSMDTCALPLQPRGRANLSGTLVG